MASTDDIPSAKEVEQVEKKANAKESLVNITSGARETVDHAVANARAVGTIMLHPFQKEKRAEAVAKARSFKAISAETQANIRAIGAQQAAQERIAVSGKSMERSPSQQDRVEQPSNTDHDDTPAAVTSDSSNPETTAPPSTPVEHPTVEPASEAPVQQPAVDAASEKTPVQQPTVNGASEEAPVQHSTVEPASEAGQAAEANPSPQV